MHHPPGRPPCYCCCCVASLRLDKSRHCAMDLPHSHCTATVATSRAVAWACACAQWMVELLVEQSLVIVMLGKQGL